MDKAVRKALGKETVSVFGLGCCGDINHVNPAAKERNRTDFIGEALGTTVVKHLGETDRVKRPTLRVRSAKVMVPMQKVSGSRQSQPGRCCSTPGQGKRSIFSIW